MTWRRHTRSADRLDRFSAAVLALTTVSYVFLWASAFHRPLLGADYSDRLSITIGSNVALNALLAIVAAIRRGPWPRRLCLSSGLVALAWLCVLAV